MSVKKAFLFSFIVFLLLNFMFTIIYFSIQGQISFLINSIAEKPFRILFYLLQPIFIFPWDVINGFFLYSERATIAMLFGFLISPFIASIVAGTYGKDVFKSFGGWCLTILTSLVMWMIFLSYDSIFRFYINSNIPLEQAIITLIINGIVSCLFYGSWAAIFSFLKKRISEFE